MKQALCLLAPLALALMIYPAIAQTSQAPAVLALNDARVGQLRYLNHLLDLNVTVSDTPYPARCLGSGIFAAEACVRTRHYSSAPLTLILANAKTAEEKRPGLATLACVGPGHTPHDPDAQSITLWPRAYGLKSVTYFARDRNRLERCIEAASAEMPR